MMGTAVESIVCRVCGDDLGSDEALACRSCGTPHHKDCWEFTGGCSVYGCGSNRTAVYARQAPMGLDQPIAPDEVMAIDENTPVPAAYARRRDNFPTPAYFAVMAYTNSITGLKLFGTGFLIWFASLTLSKLVQPFLFFSVAGSVLLLLAPIYWIAASVLGVVSLSTGLVDGRVEKKALYGLLIGAFMPVILSFYVGLGEIVVGGAAMLFAASFLFQLVRNAVAEKYQ